MREYTVKKRSLTQKHRGKARPRKELGQFFLRDKSIAKRIAAAVKPGNQLIEIGPGDGALTKELFEHGHSVIGVELDADLVEKLEKRFQHRRDFRLISGNILKINWEEFEKKDSCLTIVGNLPYHLTSPILFNIFEIVRRGTPRITECVVMVQREVGSRITAESGNKIYGALTLLTQYHGQTEYLFTVPASSFYPEPGVDGAIIRITFHEPENLPDIDYEAFRRIVRGCFAQRRKMMRNALGVVNDLPPGWANLNYDFKLRPEQFTFQDFISLTRDLLTLNAQRE